MIAIPGTEKAYWQLCFQTMRFDSLYLATGCRLYRARHGRYPETPADLIPEFIPLWPKDPYSRKPYILETNGDRLTIRTEPSEVTGPPFVRLDFPKLEIQEEEAEKEKPE